MTETLVLLTDTTEFSSVILRNLKVLKRNMDSRSQAQLAEDGVGSTRQSWIETSSLRAVVLPGTRQGSH